jgi:hypothetical protein|tara:strand:- start:170 stop:475 length:306 start_codon:yes stop_codon:yes gene_type:complete
MKIPKHPLKKYPNNKTLYKVYRGKVKKKVTKQDMERTLNRAMLVISRLSKVVVMMEDKFSETKDGVDFFMDKFEKREAEYIKAIKILKERLLDKRWNRRVN